MVAWRERQLDADLDYTKVDLKDMLDSLMVKLTGKY